MKLTKSQLFICNKFRIPTWYFRNGWIGFVKTYCKWARGYYNHPIRLLKSWLSYRRFKKKT